MSSPCSKKGRNFLIARSIIRNECAHNFFELFSIIRVHISFAGGKREFRRQMFDVVVLFKAIDIFRCIVVCERGEHALIVGDFFCQKSTDE